MKVKELEKLLQEANALRRFCKCGVEKRKLKHISWYVCPVCQKDSWDKDCERNVCKK